MSLRLPDALHEAVRKLAERGNTSIHQLLTLAVAEKIAAIETEEYLNSRASRGKREAFLGALAKVLEVAPDVADQM
jgi:predicted transcriptional regulator